MFINTIGVFIINFGRNVIMFKNILEFVFFYVIEGFFEINEISL